MSDAFAAETMEPGQVAGPVPDVLFRVGMVLVALSFVLMLAGPALAPYDPGRPGEDVGTPVNAVHRSAWMMVNMSTGSKAGTPI